MEILYEDNHVIAVNKPHGMLTQGDDPSHRDGRDDSGDANLLDEVKVFIKERDQKPGNVFIGLLHRLDRPVGGVVLFAKTSKGASRLSEQIRSHTVEKTYWAVVEGKIGEVGKTGNVTQWLRKDEATNVVTPFDHEVPGSLRAELSYRVLQVGVDSYVDPRGREVSLVEIKPKTGRPHQIRVAMSSLGTPIVGDLKYGAETKLDHDIALFARSLSFDHATTKERIIVTAEPTLSIFSSF
jgi:23S rRNA pseudouridine1911/1915/1917 synthase